MKNINQLSLPAAIVVASVVLGLFYLLSQKHQGEMSSSELYKINSDCEKSAEVWVKNNDLYPWQINRNIFNNKISACVAEFIYYDLVEKGQFNLIYNLTTNQILTQGIMQPGYKAEYQKVYDGVFGTGQ